MERSKQRAYDYALVIVLGIIIVTGLVILYSTSAYNGKLKFQDSFYYLKKQIFATLLGIAGMWIIARVDYHVWKKWSVPGYLVSVLLGIAVLLIGDEYNGSKRWLSLGPFSFQPSEFAKVAIILFLTYVIMRNVKSMGKFTTVCKIVVSVLPVVGLVGASNLSTAIIILGIAVVLVFVASPKYGQFAWMIFLGCAFMGIFLAMESYRLERLQIWRHPENYEKGYQTLQGLYAIGSGGFRSGRRIFCIIIIFNLNLAFFCDSFTCTGSGGCIDCIRGNGTYDDTGNPEHCGGDEYDPEYRNNTSVYQLWRNFGYVPAF